MADNEVSFLVKLKDSFSDGINKVIKGFTGLDAATAKSQVSTTALGVAFGQLGAKVVGIALNGLKQFGAFLVSCVYEAANAQKYINALSASLQNVGITSNYVLEDLVRYSDQLQNMSGISGDVYLEGMRLLTNFGLLGDELKRATASAYNLSAGGPLIYPQARAYVLTCICPHTLTHRSIVFDDSMTLKAKVHNPNAILIADGKPVEGWNMRESICFSVPRQTVKFLQAKEHSHFYILRTKLGWGENPGRPDSRVR